MGAVRTVCVRERAASKVVFSSVVSLSAAGAAADSGLGHRGVVGAEAVVGRQVRGAAGGCPPRPGCASGVLLARFSVLSVTVSRVERLGDDVVLWSWSHSEVSVDAGPCARRRPGQGLVGLGGEVAVVGRGVLEQPLQVGAFVLLAGRVVEDPARSGRR